MFESFLLSCYISRLFSILICSVYFCVFNCLILVVFAVLLPVYYIKSIKNYKDLMTLPSRMDTYGGYQSMEICRKCGIHPSLVSGAAIAQNISQTH